MNKRKVLLKAVNERESDSLIKESLIRYLSNTEGSEDDKERDLETLVISILNRDKGVSIYSLSSFYFSGKCSGFSRCRVGNLQ